jgi:hypothetical protein
LKLVLLAKFHPKGKMKNEKKKMKIFWGVSITKLLRGKNGQNDQVFKIGFITWSNVLFWAKKIIFLA